MAAQPVVLAVPNRQPSPGLGANLVHSPNHLTQTLKSNNPFRNRTSPATSPSPQYNLFPQNRAPPASQPSQMSRNPFLDSSEVTASPVTHVASSSRSVANTHNAATASSSADIFNGLSLNDKPPAAHGPPGSAVKIGPPPRAGTMPIRPVNSSERRDPRPRDPQAPSSPDKRAIGRPRGLSESSIMDKDKRDRRERGKRPEHRERTESEERRRRERRKEREERHRREKERSGKDRPKRPQGLDIIDKLDVTGVYGQGLFHHDGPFDACNPHRNRRNHKAPMQAFPEGSANMALGGSGPVRSNLDLDTFHGRGEEAFTGFAATRKANTTNIINPTDRTEQVHGDETYGLGTSTFLDGAPAPKSAIRRGSEEAAEANSGLSRKKSIAQRFRGMSNPRRNNPNETRSPEAIYRSTSPPQHQTASAGGPSRAKYTKENEINPFDTDYSAAFDKKGTQIRIAEQEHPANIGRPRAASASRNGLVRSVTSDSATARPSSKEDDAGPSTSGGGFLNRMKSLKGPRRTRPEGRET